MQIKKIIGLIGISIAAINVAFAATSGASNNSDINQQFPFYLELGTGASFPNSPGVSASASFWDPSPQGYNASLGNAPLFTAGVGYRVNPWLGFDISGTHRGQYSYSKYQTSTAVNTPNFQGNKTRYFELGSTAIMLDGTVYGGGLSDSMLWHTSCYSTLQPFVGAGLGTAYNTVSDFHSVVANSNAVASLMPDHSEYAFAYQFNAGLEWQYQRVGLDLGYQFFNGGKFHSNNYVYGPYTPQTAPAWSGNLRTNEVFAAVKVAV